MMSPYEFFEEMKLISYEANHHDAEGPHAMADQLMCEILTELGYGEGIKLFEDMRRWYA